MPEAIASAEADAPCRTVRRAVVADTSPRTREMAREAACALGAYEVIGYDSRAALFARLREERDRPAEAPIDVVICGRFDDGLADGGPVLERIRAERLMPPVSALVAITADRTPRALVGLAANGADACMLRPFTVEALVERMQAVLARKRPLEPVLAALQAGEWQSALEAAHRVRGVTDAVRRAALRAVCERLIDEREPTKAEQVLQQARSLGSQPWMRLALARIRSLLGDADTAQVLLDELARECPEFIATWEARANVEAGRGDFAKALQYLEEATILAGPSAGRLRRTGEMATRAGDLNAAQRCFDRLLEHGDAAGLLSAEDFAGTVAVLLRQGKFERAASVTAEFRRSRLAPDEAELVGRVVECRRAQTQGRLLRAEAALDALLQAYGRCATELSIASALLVLEACLDLGADRDARTVAQAITLSDRADEALVRRIEALIRRE